MKLNSIGAAAVGILSVLTACSAEKTSMIGEESKNMSLKMNPPIAEKIAKVDTLHGIERVDNYFWLREKENKNVIDYLKAENKYADAMTAHNAGLRETLYNEMVGRIKETDFSVPEKRGDYFYYTRTEEGKQYSLFARKKGSADAEEEVLLDQNKMAEGLNYFDMGAFEISPDHQLIAFSVDTNGSERFTLQVKDIATGEIYPDKIENIGYSVVWGNDNKTIFYNTLDAAHRPYKVFRHVLGKDVKSDELVYHEKDDQYFLYPGKTKDGKFLLLSSGSATTSEVRHLSADDPMGEFKVIHPRQHMMEYSVYHHMDKFYIVTNDGATNFKLMEVSDKSPEKENWTETISHSDDVKIDYVDMFKDHMVVYERKNGLKQIRVFDMRSGESHNVEFPEPVYTFSARRGNKEFDKKTLRFTYTSLITPKSVFDYDMDSRERELLKEYEVLGGYDKTDYTTERIFAIASDGVRVPISIVYKNDFVKDGSRPALLYGYGSYGSSREPSFDSKLLSLLDRGFVYAIAHVRGGGEMGRVWYDDGKLKNKINTFTDFIACAEHLISEGYTNPEELAIYGGSAGGLLMGAVTNMKPELFKLVVAVVPFVDVINTMLDETIPLTAIEWEEWGNPKVKEDYDYMIRYSPYDNVTGKEYPNMLIKAGLNDPRVGYWEPAKWTAKLRALKTDKNLLILKTKMGAGHMGSSGRYDYLRDKAFEYAVILDVLSVE